MEKIVLKRKYHTIDSGQSHDSQPESKVFKKQSIFFGVEGTGGYL
jgi:hypothetical protein